MIETLEVEDIKEILPHRPPFLLVDRITQLVPGKGIVGIKNVTVNEPFFQGHFPGYPVMPGVLIIEAMAQVGAILAYKSAKGGAQGKYLLLTAMDRVKFRKPVVPGDQIRFEISMIRQKSKVCRMKGLAYVGNSLVAEAELMAAIMDRRVQDMGKAEVSSEYP